MIDREKVINGLEHCGHPTECDGCPYDSPLGRCFTKLKEDALKLLKEQEPIPIQKREMEHMWYWCCGSCGVAITEGDKFCRMCGRMVKWNDTGKRRDIN